MEIPELLGMSEISSAPFQAIKTVGRLKALEWQRVSAIQHGHGYKLQSLIVQRAQLVNDWEGHRAKLPLHDVEEIIARYPWVRHL